MRFQNNSIEDNIDVHDSHHHSYEATKELIQSKNISYNPSGRFVAVEGDLDLSGTRPWLPSVGLTVKGNLNLCSSILDGFPKYLDVEGDLNLSNSQGLFRLNYLSVGGNLYLNDSQISKLPNRLEVGGDLDICRTRIDRLPRHLHVRNLHIDGFYYSRLHSKIVVCGNLHLHDSSELGWHPIRMPQVNGFLCLGESPITKVEKGDYVTFHLYERMPLPLLDWPNAIACRFTCGGRRGLADNGGWILDARRALLVESRGSIIKVIHF